MAWIKMRTDLDRDPAVIQLAEHFGWPEHVIVGLLHKLWSWADEQISDGNAPGVTRSFIDRYLGVSGFAEMLQCVGWLTEIDGGISFPNWERHMGQSAKTRATTAVRVAKSRARAGNECNGASVTKALPEKIREDKRERECAAAPPPPPDNGKPKRKTFKPPTVAEVAEYCLSRKNYIDPEHFVDWHESRGWRLSGGNAMKDWQATVRTWERRDNGAAGGSQKYDSITGEPK